MWPATKAARRRLLAAGGAAAALSLAGIAIAHRTPALYRLGLVAPFEGLFRSSGYDALAAARAVVEEWNERFRPLAFQVQVWAVDDGNDPAAAALRARELVQDPLALAVVGHLAPETSVAGAAHYRPAGLLQVSPVPMGPTAALAQGVTFSAGVAPSQADRCLSGAGLECQSCTGSSGGTSGCGLLELTAELASRSPEASEVCLTLGYCPDALSLTFPEVGFSTVAAGATASLAGLVSRATSTVLEAVLVAAESGQPTRAGVAAAALQAARQGQWTCEDGVWYPALENDPVLERCGAEV